MKDGYKYKYCTAEHDDDTRAVFAADYKYIMQ